jgi:hypothetical protein
VFVGVKTIYPVTSDSVVVAVQAVPAGAVEVSTTPAAVAVALAESVKLPMPFAASVALLGIPGPVMVSPAARPNELDTPVTVALPLVVDPVKNIEHAGIVGPVPGAAAMIGTNVSEMETVPEGVPFPCDTNVVMPMP